MFIHHFDSETGEYLSSSLATPDSRNEGRWLIPAFATDSTIPERSRYTWPFWRDETWILLPDHRGRILYRTSNGESAEISCAGVTPEDAGLTDHARPSDEYVWKHGKWTIDPVIASAARKQRALRDFEKRYGETQRQTLGKESAFSAGLLDDLAAATFKAWVKYQMQLVDVVNSAEFPDRCDWPEKPDAEAIERVRNEMADEKARIDALKAADSSRPQIAER